MSFPVNGSENKKKYANVLGMEYAAIVVLLGVVFLFDVSVFLGIAAALLYVVPVLLTVRLSREYSTFAVATIATVLTLAGYALSPPYYVDAGQAEWQVLANRSLVLLGIWGAVVLCALYRRAATEAERTESRLRSIIDTSLDAVATIDERGTLLSFSKGGEKLFGYKEEEVRGRNVKMLMPSPYKEGHDGYIQKYLKTGEKRVIGAGRIVKAKRKDGTVFPIHLVVGEMVEDGQRLFTGFIHDMTDRILAEEEMVAERNFVAALLDTTDALVVVIDKDGLIVRFNKACERLSGYRAQEVKGRVLWHLFPPEERKKIQEDPRHFWNDAQTSRIEGQWQTRDGRVRMISWTIAQLRRDGGGEYYRVGVGIDVTDTREAQDRIAKLQQDLFQIGRLSELGEMAAAIAHELNQPLTAASNYSLAAHRLIGQLESDEKAKAKAKAKALGLMDKSIEQIGRAGQIIRRLRQLIGRGQAEMKHVDINTLVNDACDLALIGSEEKGVSVKFDLTLGLPLIWADPTQIQQIVFNLLRNAVEAMEDVERRELTIATAASTDDGVEVRVADTGPGLDKEIAAGLFTPFSTTKATGMGIGLSICRSIIDAHDGRIWAEPNEGGGTVFHFTLPAG